MSSRSEVDAAVERLREYAVVYGAVARGLDRGVNGPA